LSDLRTRIAAVLRERVACGHGDTYETVADAVIRELGLQPHLAKRIINGKPDQWVRRHETDWEIVDE
jgi:hypothetical protein